MPTKMEFNTAFCKRTSSAALSPWVLAGAALATYGGAMRHAYASGLTVTDPGVMQIAQAAAPVPFPSALIPQQLKGPAEIPYAKADELKLRGWIIPVPGAANTLDQGLFGVRNTLADQGISYLGIAGTTFGDNMLRHALPAGNALGKHSRDAQQYLGQLPTYTLGDYAYLMYDLRRFGIPDGQITVGAGLVSANWNPAGPDGVFLETASYYQTLFNKRVEIKLGYLDNSLEFLGTQVGGSLASGIFGPNAALVTENGENSSSFPTPGVNVKVNLPDNFYSKLGVARGISPNGALVERAQNPSAVRFVVPNSGLWVMDETGYRVSAAPGRPQTWIRAAASYTSSKYTDITTGQRHGSNFGLFLLADRQVLQTSPHGGPGSSIRGIYAGFSVEYAPSYFNTFSQYYEGRLYGFGLIPGRPFDLISVVATRNVYSEDAVRIARAHGSLAHDDVNAITASYGARIIPGVTANVGLQYTDHPTVITYTRSTGSSLNILLNTIIFL